MVQTGRFAFDDGWQWDPRDWGREWDDLGDEFPSAEELAEASAEVPPDELGDDEAAGNDVEPVEKSPRRHLADADWLKPRRRRKRRAG